MTPSVLQHSLDLELNGNPLILWPYQIDAISWPGKRKVRRWARRTGKTLTSAVEISYYLKYPWMLPHSKEIDRKNFRILVIAPQKTHVEYLFDCIREFMVNDREIIDRNCKGSPQIISSEVDDYTCTVSGFTSSSSAGQGLSIRGQDADWIFLEEGDYISKETFECTVLCMIITRLNTGITISSTPSGIKGGPLDQLCCRFPKDLHWVPGVRRPDWSSVEKLVMMEYLNNPEMFCREILAL